MELLIDLVTLKDQNILDPFIGSGTTCVAASKLKRNYVGIDIDNNNLMIAQKRLKK